MFLCLLIKQYLLFDKLINSIFDLMSNTKNRWGMDILTITPPLSENSRKYAPEISKTTK